MRFRVSSFWRGCIRPALSLCFCAWFAVLVVGCSPPANADAGDGAAADATDMDGSPADSGGDGGADAAPIGTVVRFANFVPNAPAFDICYRPNEVGRMFTGPLMRSLGVMGGLRYGQISEYVRVDPRMHAWRLVAPSATDCNTPLMDSPPMTYFNPGAVNSRTTVAAIGILGGATPMNFRSINVEDPPDNAMMGSVQYSVLSALLGASTVEFGIVSGGVFTAIVTGVDFGSMRTAMGMPLMGATVGVRRSGMTTQDVEGTNVTIPESKSRSVFIHGVNGDASAPVTLLICDNTRSLNHLSMCETFRAM